MPGPPPPPPPTFNLGGGSAEQGRGALLQSIRTGTTLKKTVTNDKSAPAISGKVKSGSSNVNTPPSTKSSTNSANSGNSSVNNGGPIGLGGLFAGGMPKLKATGLRSNLGAGSLGSATLPSTKRGPPPVPPPAAQKPQIYNPTVPQSSPDGAKPTVTPRILAQQQPQTLSQKPSPPPKKLNLGANNVSRAQSMRLPRSPPVLAPPPPSLHQSQDSLHEPQQRRPVLKPPCVRPPSPPVTKSNGITRAAPPPPCRAPTMPPPPPPLPHRNTASTSVSNASTVAAVPHTRLAPPVPPPPTPATPPTPPTRNQSLRNGQSTLQGSLADFEARFADCFHSIANFPPPEPFRNVPKVYNSKTVAAAVAKQQAPAPPQRFVSNAGNSNMSAGKPQQWQQQNASSAC